MSIVEFLQARIAEDEAQITKERAEHEAWMAGQLPGGTYAIPWFHFDRLQAEVEAKRQIVELHDGSHECSTYDHRGDIDNCTWCEHSEECTTLRLLATVYADHPDYREAWRP